MSTKSPSQFAQPRIDARALLGLHDPASDFAWGPIRAAQIDTGRKLAIFLLAANLVGAALVTFTLKAITPFWAIASWGALTAIVAAAIAGRRLLSPLGKERVATMKNVRDTVQDGVALAIVWSIAPLAFGLKADTGTALGLWIILSVVMTASAFAMAGLLPAAFGFLAILGAATTVLLLVAAGPVLAGISLVFTALLMLVSFSRARAAVVIHIGNTSGAERDETVRLLLRDFEDSNGDWLWEIDAQRRIIHASTRFAHSVGLDPVSVNGQPFLQVLAGPTWENGDFGQGLRTLADKLKGREAFRDLVVAVPVKGEQHWWEIAASPRFDASGTFVGFRGVGSDVTEQRASADKIRQMAHFDPLTGLPNRLLLNDALGRAMAEAEKWGSRCAFMMIDLDRFKAINDSLGHPVGDVLLGHVATRLGQLVTENEMIGRLGGDEFAVVVRDAGPPGKIKELARTIIAALSQPYELDTKTLFIGASIGVAIGPDDGKTAETLIRSADLALYRAKEAGGGAFHCYEHQMHVAAEERHVLETALHSALKNGELHLNYQPVVDTAKGTLAGFEALLRWQHPELGNISPAKFVSLAEDAGMIVSIGEWVLRTACEEAMRWTNPVRVAVNVSPEQLHNAQFVTVVASALANSGLPPHRLELEVTEGVFMKEGSPAIKVLEQILDLGVRLCLDDFGTGYNSLGYLSRKRFSSIKIDRSFVTQAARGAAEAVAIIGAVVALARSLGMATSAEGIETEDEYRMVRELGCTEMQGYLFGSPLSVAEARVVADRNYDASAAA